MNQPDIFKDLPVKYASSTKKDGHMSFGHIDEASTKDNIIRFINALEWSYSYLGFIRIKYGQTESYNRVKFVNTEEEPTNTVSISNSHRTDALITNTPGTVLLLPTADCYPITLFDPVNNALGLAHLGWHSTNAHLLEKTVDRFKGEFRSNPKDILVHIGPGIPKKYYVFNEPVQLKRASWEPYLTKTSGGYQIDLLGYNLKQLELAGLDINNIEKDKRNVVDDPSIESHYMHKKYNKPTAIRFLTAVMLDSVANF